MINFFDMSVPERQAVLLALFDIYEAAIGTRLLPDAKAKWIKEAKDTKSLNEFYQRIVEGIKNNRFDAERLKDVKHFLS